MKLITMQSPPVPYCFVPLRPKYLPQHPLVKQPQNMFLPQCEYWLHMTMIMCQSLVHIHIYAVFMLVLMYIYPVHGQIHLI